MKKNILYKVIIGVLLLSSFEGISQSNPTPFNLATGGTYNFSDWPSASTASTYPRNMIFHILANANSTLAVATASGNVSGVYNDVSSKTRMNGMGTGGFSFRNSPVVPDITGYVSKRLGEAVLGLNTTNRTNIQLSWSSGEIGSVTPIYGITCQYRIGTSGAYLALPGLSSSWQYLSNNPLASESFGPITLPATCDNQSVVQIRWVYHYVSGSTAIAGAQLFVDDISVSSIPAVILSPLPNTCNLAPSFLLTDGQPAGGVYSGIGISGNYFSPTIAGNGIHTITYTYTDGNGFSNFATTDIDVNSSSCVTTTSLTPTSCGATGLSINSYIYCETVYGAEDYEFLLTNVSLGFSQSNTRGSGVANFRLNNISGLQYGQTYDVKVKAKIAGIWGDYGTICPITLMPFPSTNLNSTSCGATELNPTSYIYCNIVPGATEYEYTISNTSLGYYSVKSFLHFIKLTKYTGLKYDETYDVSVRAKVGGVYGPAGSVCQISMKTFPSTSLDSISCGATNLTTASYLHCDIIYGSTNYEFTITNSSLGYSYAKNIGSGYQYLKLSNFPGLLAGETYDVNVKGYVGDVWGPTGPTCQITLAAAPGVLSPISEGSKQMDLNIENTTFLIYPNPATLNNSLTIELPTEQTVTAIITDILGRKVYEKKFISENSLEIALSEIQIKPGIYILAIINGNTSQNQKIVISE